MIESEVPAFTRRSAYEYKLHAPDYFVLKHLFHYLKGKIDERIRRGLRVADIGCGEQPLRRWIEIRGGTYTGIDIRQNSTDTVDVIAPIHCLPFGDEVFDVIFCTEVLEHVAETERAIREMSRILKRGGVIVITVPFAYPLHEEPFDYWRITPFEIEGCASILGLEIMLLDVAGNELEAIATIWCNLWSRAGLKETKVWKYWKKFMRTPVNVLVLMFSKILNNRLPRKFFLHTFAELRKPG